MRCINQFWIYNKSDKCLLPLDKTNLDMLGICINLDNVDIPKDDLTNYKLECLRELYDDISPILIEAQK